MATPTVLVGRRAERDWLENALSRARDGRGSLVLVAGEAGVGKTRLTGDLAEGCGLRWLRGRAGHGDGAAYGVLADALRAHLRAEPEALADPGLRARLAPVLPEFGPVGETGERAGLAEAVCDALEAICAGDPAVLVLDDLQWSDAATLELLGALAEPLGSLPLLVVGTYRSDGLPRDHALRRLRHDLRGGRRLDELVLGPLGPDETAELAAQVLGEPLAPALALAFHDRTQGVPFFAEELARALATAGALAGGPQGLAMAEDGEVPVPATVLDAVLISASELSPAARAAGDAAAVAGESFDPELVAAIAGAEGLAELVERGWVVEEDGGRGAFRHSLTREALYADVPWLRRRGLHREIGEALEAAGAPGSELAPHWLGARDAVRARAALMRAAQELRAVHAYRDAARAGRQALELWPEGEETGERLATLESYATNAELAGELAEAARAWREVSDLHAGPDAVGRLADAQRRLAGVHDLRGDRESALAARRAAAEAYAAAGLPAEAAAEHIGAANYLRARAEYTPAIELARLARAEAASAGRVDLQARAQGLEGVAQAKRGDHAGGLETVRAGLALALGSGLTTVAAELYQRLGLALYDSGDYRRAEVALDSALELCERDGQLDVEVACVTCMVYVLRECGDWPRALELGRNLIDAGNAVWVAEGLVGAIYAFQGRLGAGRRLLASSLSVSSRVSHFNMSVDSTAALAWIAAAEGEDDEAGRRCHDVLGRWERSEDHHYAVRGLRWASGFFARRGDLPDAHRCAEALAAIASRTGHPDALAALAYAIGEAALAQGDVATAAEQLVRGVELHGILDVPLDRAEIGVRAGVALAACGDREGGLERLAEAYRTARRIGARPLASEAAAEVARLGESVARRLGRRAEADAEGGGLSRRELEVVRLVAAGHTNREIAQELYLSPRTIDMHVRSILRRLGCRSRTEAAQRAGELGLLAPALAADAPDGG